MPDADPNGCLADLAALRHDLHLRTDAMETSLTGMSILKPDGTHVYVNPALVEMSGAGSRETLLGTNAAAFHEDPVELEEIVQQLQVHGSYSGEFVAKRLDGTTVPVLFGASVLRAPGGDVEYIMATFVDVTRWKLAESRAREQADRFNHLLTVTPQGYWLVGRDRELIDVNRSACEMLGYTREEMLALRVNDIEVLETPEETQQRIERLTHHGYDRFETRHRKRDGSVIDVIVSVTLLTAEDGPRLLAFIEDISEQKRIESLEREREIAVRASHAKSAFLQNITHELRTPLNSIMGFAQLLQNDSVLSEGHAGFVQEILRAGEQLSSLVDTILDFTRIESGAMELALVPVDCGELVSEAVQSVEAKASEHGIRIRYALPAAGEAPADEESTFEVRADPSRLRQVLLNLLSNSIVYNKPEGEVEVSVQAADDTVRITVSDTGVGIPVDRQGEIFLSFNRLGREALNISGTGLGLVYGKRLVELMGGTIAFESTEGVGSSFWIELPRASTGDE